MNSNDIPPVPQFLLRNADRHHVHAFAADLPDSDQTADSREDAAASPRLDLSEVDLLAEGPADVFPGRIDILAPPPAPPPVPASSPAPSGRFYSVTDLALFRALTGYSLDIRVNMPRAIDGGGNRASIMDRLFTTLAEEAFGLAVRQRRTGAFPDGDLTIEDIAATLVPMRRAAAAIGSRGLVAFERLEGAVARLTSSVMAVPEPPDADAVTA